MVTCGVASGKIQMEINYNVTKYCAYYLIFMSPHQRTVIYQDIQFILKNPDLKVIINLPSLPMHLGGLRVDWRVS